LRTDTHGHARDPQHTGKRERESEKREGEKPGKKLGKCTFIHTWNQQNYARKKKRKKKMRRGATGAATRFRFFCRVRALPFLERRKK